VSRIWPCYQGRARRSADRLAWSSVPPLLNGSMGYGSLHVTLRCGLTLWVHDGLEHQPWERIRGTGNDADHNDGRQSGQPSQEDSDGAGEER
jgi:hypothetical protein